jgi:hypothetical protein
LLHISFVEISIFKFDAVNVHISTRYWLVHIKEWKNGMGNNFGRRIRASFRIYFNSIELNDNRSVRIENRGEMNRFISQYNLLSKRSD